MMNLILKDLLVWKRMSLLTLAFYGVLMTVLFPMLRELHFMYPSLCIQGICYLLILPHYQNKLKKGEIVFLSLPVSRKMVVQARYYTSFITAAAGIAFFSLLLIILIKFFPFKDYDRVMSLGVLFTTLVMVFLFIAFTFPLIYKLGLALGIVMSAMIPAFFVYITYGLSKGGMFTDSIFNGMRWLDKLSVYSNVPENLPLLLLFLGCIVYVSMLLTVRIYKKAEIA